MESASMENYDDVYLYLYTELVHTNTDQLFAVDSQPASSARSPNVA